MKIKNLFKRISASKDDGGIYPTVPERTNGIFVNGVELINYKSEDLVRYGEIESIDVLDPGSNIDVINVPSLVIDDAVGTGATGYAAIKGTVTEIRVEEPGFDYVREPTVTISGGNGSGAKANVSMKQINHKVDFFADVASANVTIGSTQSIIGFSTYHKFRDAEKVLYRTQVKLLLVAFQQTLNTISLRLATLRSNCIKQRAMLTLASTPFS